MSLLFDVVLCICLIPILFVMFLYLYPKDWKNSKLIFGVSRRDEYFEKETIKLVEGITRRRRKQAVIVLVSSIAVSVLLLVFNGFALQTTMWMILFYASVVGIFMPFFLGNREMKSLKRTLGIVSQNRVSFTDFKNVGTVRTFKLSKTLPQNVSGLLILIFAFLVDMKVIPMDTATGDSFLGTGITAVFFGIGLVITGVAFFLDGFKNEVISSDSTVNANYNRALKKNLLNFSLIMLWINVVLMASFLVFSFLWYSEIGIMITGPLYVVIMTAAAGFLMLRKRKIETMYETEAKLATDEDDCWLGGMLYYNPDNKRLLVKKRVGLGGTINAARPAGKAICVITALMMVVALSAIIYLGLAEATPLKLQIDDGRLICHHLVDDYVVYIDHISKMEYKDDSDELDFIKLAGFATAKLRKGDFSVNGKSVCKVFMYPQQNTYIRFVADNVTYFINMDSAGETERFFEELKKNGAQLRPVALESN